MTFSGNRVRNAAANPLVIGTVIFALTLAGSALEALLMYRHGLIPDPWIIALSLSTTSLGVVVPVLKEKGLSKGVYGQNILVSSLVADFATILLISIYVLPRTQGLTAEILFVLLLFAAFLAAHQIANPNDIFPRNESLRDCQRPHRRSS